MGKRRARPPEDAAEGGLRAFLDGGALERAADGLRRRLRDRPADPASLRDLALVLRQSGDLEGAARVYQRLSEVSPGDAIAAVRLAVLLRGGTPQAAEPAPVRFFRAPQFLPQGRLEEIRAHALERKKAFAATAVRGEDGMQTETKARRSTSCTDVDAIRAWFDALVLERFPEMVRRLGLEPFEPAVMSCKLSAFHDGHFFRLHQDRATGAAATRKMGFLFYFDFPPRRFEGGELLLYDLDPDTLFPAPRFTNLPPDGNSLVVLPAACWHEVLPVRCRSREWTAGRFTYGGWIHDAGLMDPA